MIGMYNEQEEKVRTPGALTEGTRHRGDKGCAVEHHDSLRGNQTLGGPRGAV